jgi:DHA1 family bicyclomycin/chloramphenicol resistance-like MFS transporter
MQQSKVISPIFIILFALLTSISVDIYIPALPQIGIFFHTTYQVTQFTMSLYLAAYAVAQLIIGPLSDYFGRRKVLLIGLLCYCLGSIICAFSMSIASLIFGRMLQGTGACSGIITAFAYARLYEDQAVRTRIITLITTSMSIITVIAPALGNLMLRIYNWQSIFWLLSIIALLVLVIAFLYVPKDSIKNSDQVNILYGYHQLSNKSYWLYIANIALSFSMLLSLITYFPWLIENNFEVYKNDIGVILSALSIFLILGGILTNLATRKIKVSKILLYSNLILFIGVLLFSVSGKNFVLFFSSIAFIMLGVAINIPSLISCALESAKNNAATASAVMGFSRYCMATTVITLIAATMSVYSSLIIYLYISIVFIFLLLWIVNLRD